ncbi:MAG TPA: carboxypeptidase-like regulatory domain-containing protein, partial [Pyrinomonadaceae bacterium]|nr:carboxypeptidase-like regulatory domain-containing protein [Pyrinomonadaceae bacterium]
MNRLTSSLLRALTCGLFLFLFVGAVNAQFKAGVQGTITDASGGLIPDAKVTLSDTETGQSKEATSNEDG